jgi:3-hydroxyisobutyrate dehydrogenase-like beta-hydroxyacid dehydrogenase
MNQKVTQVGFIGLGRMGKPMAVNIVHVGFALTVCDSRPEPVRELAALGARMPDRPRKSPKARTSSPPLSWTMLKSKAW